MAFGYKSDTGPASMTVSSIQFIREDNYMFIHSYAVDLRTGRSYQGDAYVKGIVNASLMYLPTKWFIVTNQNTIDYYIDPVNEPYSCYAVETNNVLGYVHLYLPSASLYDGLELKFFWLKRGFLGIENVEPMAILTGTPTTPVWNLWVYRSNDDDYVGAYACYPLVGEVRIKAYNGRWVVIDGDFNYLY